MKNLVLLALFCLIASWSNAQHRSPAAQKQAPVIDPTQLQGPPPDVTPPVVTCLDLGQEDLLYFGQLSFWAADFLQSLSDNITPAGMIPIGIRKAGTGTGFPVDQTGSPLYSVTYGCNELGSQPVELWAIDGAGNASYCDAKVEITDSHDYCSLQHLDTVSVCVTNGCDNTPLPGVQISIGNSLPFIPPYIFLDTTKTGADGCLKLALNYNFDYGLTPEIDPADDDPLNGLNTLDLLLISEHIQGVNPFDNPYKYIAADANKSGSITSFDLVEFRKLIEGIYSELPSNTTWRFVDADFVFPNPVNPFMTAFPESITLSPGNIDSTYGFVGVKIGDVDCSAKLQLQDYPDAYLSFPDTMLAAGQTYEIPLFMPHTETWTGYQFTLSYLQDKLKFLNVVAGQWGGLLDWGTGTPGKLTTSWMSPANPVYFTPGAPIATFSFKALADVNLSDVISIDPQRIRPQGYVGFANDVRDLSLQFVPQLTGNHPVDRSLNGAILKVSQPYPNPGTGKLYLPIFLKEANSLQLRIFDANGALVMDRIELFSEGSHLWEIPEEVFPHAGVYGWQLLAGDQVFGGKFLRGF